MARITTSSFFKNESNKTITAFSTHEEYHDSNPWTAWTYEIAPHGKVRTAKFDTGTGHETFMRFTVYQSIDPKISVEAELKRKLEKGDAVYAVFTADYKLEIFVKPLDSPDIGLEALKDPSLWELSPDQKVS